MDEEVRSCVLQQKIFRKGNLYRRKNSSEIVYLLAQTSTSKDVFLLLLIRVMEYIGRAYPLALFTHFKTNFYSIGIYRVLRCVFLKNQNIVKVMKWARPWSSLVVGDLGWIGQSRKMLCLC